MMTKEEMIKEHFNYLLEMHTNSLKALGSNGVLQGDKPHEIVETLSYMDSAFRQLVNDECRNFKVDKSYYDFITSQVTSIYKIAMEVTQRYYLHYHGIVSKDEWEEVTLYEESE